MPENVESQITRSEDDANRVVKLNATGELDSNTVFYRTTLRRNRAQETAATRPVQQPSTLGQQIVDKQVSQARRTANEVKEALTENTPTENINSLIEEAKGSTSSDFAFARQLYRLAIRTRDNRVRTLQSVLELDGSSIELTSFLLNEADIPARVGNGILLKSDLRYHVHNILSGMFSLSGQSDIAFIEETVEFDPVFDEITYLGVPDLRIIVYRGVPVMAMLRLPSKASDGKANLHKGGLGVGIDIATGKTIAGIQYNRYIETHPDTDGALKGHSIPDWDKILAMAAKLGDHTEFSYLGIDIVLDKERGPLLLEMNARPGLSVQIANQAGLLPRLDKVDAELGHLETAEEKIEFAKAQFAVGRV